MNFCRFPLDNPELLTKWLVAMRRDHWTPTKTSYMCSQHFLPTDYTDAPFSQHLSKSSRKFLKRDAVPSLFEFPGHLQKKPSKERNPKKRVFVDKVVETEKQNKAPKLDHTYSTNLSPTKMQAKFKEKLKRKNRVIKNLQQKNLRKTRTIRGLVEKLRISKMVSEESEGTLINNFGHMTTEVFRNEIKNNTKSSGSRYSDQIKEFAVSLHYYSPRAYRFVRKYLSLPHPATIRSWSAGIECEPGFLEKPLLYIADLVKDGQRDCVIIIDEMAIKKETKWDPKGEKFVGNIDYGKIKGEDPDNIATNALVIMISGLKKPWHVPLAYFLTNKLNADILAQLIQGSIKMLHEIGCLVHAVIFDGAAKNIGMAEKLGCDIRHFEGSFPHPNEANNRVYVIFDICHMIKLARNAFSDMKSFCKPNGDKISWEYIVALYHTQQKDILHLGNKIKSKHIKWQNHKMKVSVATQIFSNSVYAAITFLRKLKLKGFERSKPTSDFILLMNDMFDMLNSKSKFGKYSKQPINLENLYEIESKLKDGVTFLKSLKDTSGLPLIQGPRKTFIIGFSISALSIIAISKNLLQGTESPFEYVLTYRFSQDTLEMYFSKIRGRFGWNNNPTALQFKYALRSLLLKNKIEAPTTANCALQVSQEDAEDETGKTDPKISTLLLSSNEWRNDVLYYISGYIVHKILQIIDCPECAGALYDNPDIVGNNWLAQRKSLLYCKMYGALKLPSQSVFKVVSCTDRVVRKSLCSWSSFTRKIKLAITISVLQETRNSVFSSIQEHSMENHVLDTDFRDDHITVIIKLIINTYLTTFLHQFARVYTQRIIKGNKPSRRNKLTKTILFQNE